MTRSRIVDRNIEVSIRRPAEPIANVPRPPGVWGKQPCDYQASASGGAAVPGSRTAASGGEQAIMPILRSNGVELCIVRPKFSRACDMLEGGPTMSPCGTEKEMQVIAWVTVSESGCKSYWYHEPFSR
jgi:hypothetical protein